MLRKLLMVLTVLCLVCSVSNAEILKVKECKLEKIAKDYYVGLLTALTQKLKNFKYDRIDIYSKKIDDNMCLFYMDPKAYNLNVSPDKLFLFTDNKKYYFINVIDTKLGVDLASYYQTKINKIDNVNYADAMPVYINKKSRNNIVLYISLECPYCSYLYQTMYTLFNNIIKTKGEINTNLYMYITSGDQNKVKLFKKIADKDPMIFLQLLYYYYKDNALSAGVSDIKFKYKSMISKFNPDDLSTVVISKMEAGFKDLTAEGVPVTIVNGRVIEGANIPLLNVVLKEENIGDMSSVVKQ